MVVVVVVVVNRGSLPGRDEHELASDFQAIGSFCVMLLSMSCQHPVCFDYQGGLISIITTRYTGNAMSERGMQKVIGPATSEPEP